MLPIAPSTYYTHAARKADPDLRPNRAGKDDALCVEIRRVFDENQRVDGPRKVWRQLIREGYRVARCTVERLMRRLGLDLGMPSKPHSSGFACFNFASRFLPRASQNRRADQPC